MRSARLLTIGALSAALILPTVALAQEPAGTAFTATINVKKAYSNIRAVDIGLGKTNVPSGTSVNAYLVSETGSPDPLKGDGRWRTLPTSITLSNADGEHTVYAWARATGGIVSERGSDTVFLDRVKPETASVSTTPAQTTDPDPDPVITSRSVSITFSYSDPGEGATPATGSGVARYAVVNGTTVPVSSSTAWKTAPNATGPVTVAHNVSSGNGAKTVTIFVRDRAGNVSVASSVNFTLQVAGPTVTLTAPDYTKINKPAIKVVAKQGTTVLTGAQFFRKVTTTNTQPDAPLASANGWVVAPTLATMAQVGDNWLWVWAKDSNGSVSSSPAMKKIVYDNVNPTASFEFDETESSGVDTTTDRSVEYTASFSDANTTVTDWVIKNGTATPASGEWKTVATALADPWVLPLGDGTKTVTLWVRDAAGNVASASDTISMALADPTVNVDITATNAYKDGSNNWWTKNLPVSVDIDWVDNAGVGKDAAQYKLTLNNTTPTTWSSAATSINLADTSDGTQTIHAWVKDKNGSIGHGTTTIYLDRSGPAISFTAPANSPVRAITLTISVNDGSGVGVEKYATVQGTTQPASNSVAWTNSPTTSFTLPDAEGTTQITVWSRDKLGNVSGVTRTVRLDRVNPSATLSVVSPGNTRNASVTVGGSDSGSGIAEYAVVEGTSAPASNSPSWVASPPTTFQVSSGDGSKTISAFTRDAAGNVSAANTKTFVLDTTAPTVSLTTPNNTLVQLISITVSGADTGGTGVAKYVVVEGTDAPALNDPAWTVSAPTEFTLSSGTGPKTVSAFTVDNAGNVSLADTEVVWVD